MPELNQGPLSEQQGQAGPDTGSAAGDPGAAPSGGEGQANGQAAQTQQGQAGDGTQAGESTFFDPSQLPPELMSVYKQMQSAFTKKTQEIGKHRQKIEVYDQFMADPVGNLQRMAGQYGYQLSRADAKAMLNQQNGQPQNAQQGQPWQPQNWDEVMERATKMAEERIMQQISPLFQNVQQMHAKSIEQQLDSLDSNWRVYEDEMRENMRVHPSLVNDVGKLYKLSVPDDVLASKATQSALKKLEGTAKAAQVSGSGQSSRTTSAPQTVKSFDDAVAEARRQLSKGR